MYAHEILPFVNAGIGAVVLVVLLITMTKAHRHIENRIEQLIQLVRQDLLRRSPHNHDHR